MKWNATDRPDVWHGRVDGRIVAFVSATHDGMATWVTANDDGLAFNAAHAKLLVETRYTEALR